MRGLLFCIAVAALVPAMGAGAALAHGGTEVTVGVSVQPNGPIKVNGVKFSPEDTVKVIISKPGIRPVEIGVMRTDRDGGFEGTLQVPGDLRPGLYKLTAEGRKSESIQISIIAPRGASGGARNREPEGPVSYDRPVSETVGLAIVIFILAALGAGVLLVSRATPRRG